MMGEGGLAPAPLAKRKKANKISQPVQLDVTPDLPERDDCVTASTPALARCAGAAHSDRADPHDDVPIGKKGPSTFEELLEQELARDASSEVQAQTSKSASKGAKLYLKRGTCSPLCPPQPCRRPALD